MTSATTPVYVTDDGNGKLAVITGTRCSKRYCCEYGCDFPNCATLGQRFDSLEDAKKYYPVQEVRLV